MFDNHDASLGEKLLRVVVDKLSVNENVGSVGQNFLNLGVHLGLFSSFNVSDGSHGVDLDLGAHDFDLVVVHRRVGDEDTRVLDAALAASRDLLLQHHAFRDERVAQRATWLLDNLDVV